MGSGGLLHAANFWQPGTPQAELWPIVEITSLPVSVQKRKGILTREI